MPFLCKQHAVSLKKVNELLTKLRVWKKARLYRKMKQWKSNWIVWECLPKPAGKNEPMFIGS